MAHLRNSKKHHGNGMLRVVNLTDMLDCTEVFRRRQLEQQKKVQKSATHTAHFANNGENNVLRQPFKELDLNQMSQSG